MRNDGKKMQEYKLVVTGRMSADAEEAEGMTVDGEGLTNGMLLRVLLSTLGSWVADVCRQGGLTEKEKAGVAEDIANAVRESIELALLEEKQEAAGGLRM